MNPTNPGFSRLVRNGLPGQTSGCLTRVMTGVLAAGLPSNPKPKLGAEIGKKKTTKELQLMVHFWQQDNKIQPWVSNSTLVIPAVKMRAVDDQNLDKGGSCATNWDSKGPTNFMSFTLKNHREKPRQPIGWLVTASPGCGLCPSSWRACKADPSC